MSDEAFGRRDADQAVQLHRELTEMHGGWPPMMVPVRVFKDRAMGEWKKIPRFQWRNEPRRVVSTEDGIKVLWDEAGPSWAGVITDESGIRLMDLDVDLDAMDDEVPPDLMVLIRAARESTWWGGSATKALDHFAYHQDTPTAKTDWRWRGDKIGDDVGRGLWVVGSVVVARPLAPFDGRLVAAPRRAPAGGRASTGGGGGGQRDEDDDEPSTREVVTYWMIHTGQEPGRVDVDEALDWAHNWLQRLREAPDHERNNRLYHASREVWQIVSAGALTEDDGKAALLDAAAYVFTPAEQAGEVQTTIESAFRRGDT